jgi:hypothetical protein
VAYPMRSVCGDRRVCDDGGSRAGVVSNTTVGDLTHD